jgi:serine protease Do
MREADMALESPPEKPAADKTLIKGRNPFEGATVANLSPAIADEMGLDTLAAGGVVITDIEDGSTADRIQFQAGDIVEAIGDTKIGSVKEFKSIVGTPRRQWDFAIRRGDRTFTASVGG